jgi:DNA polymerase III sliding clamp (beta) subunit (PCNA family)
LRHDRPDDNRLPRTPLDVGFTSAYVLDALHRIATPAVRLRLGEPGAGIIFEPDMGGSPSDYLYVVMPLREPE